MDDSFFWLNRPPAYSNRRINPGLRHRSRLFTDPIPFKRENEQYPEAQLKKLRNSPSSNTQLLVLLNEAKNLFHKQLPNMGASYISRLVFDFNAETVLLLHNGQVTGAISSRLFFKEDFIEVVFLAVKSTYQSRGYGKLIMNYLKSVIQVYQFVDILACADNEAVIFFKKQGFNDKGIFMDPARWVGRIKDYEGVTLVHCKIHPDIDYMHFGSLINEQINITEKRFGKHVIPTPEEFQAPFTLFPGGPTYTSIAMPKILEHINCGRKDYEHEKPSQYFNRMEDLKKKLSKILEELEKDNDLSSIFYSPVTEEIAPTYFSIVKHPMDLFTIKKRLMRFKDYYKRPEVFAADINLIVENCKAFNPPNSVYTSAANVLQSKFKQLYLSEFPSQADQKG